MRRFKRAVAFMFAFCALFAGRPAFAQPCPAEDGTLFVITYEYLYSDPFTSGQVINTAGPYYGTSSIQAYYESAPTAQAPIVRRRTDVTTSADIGGGGGSGSLAFTFKHDMLVRAIKTAGTLYGGGVRMNVDIYLKDAPPGTPFTVTSRFKGPITAVHGDSFGRTDTFFGDATVGGTTGSYGITLDTKKQDDPSVTSDSHPPNGNLRYFFGKRLSITGISWVWQSFDICFFGCPPPTDYTGTIDVGGFVDVVRGQPPCNGTITGPVYTSDCSESISSNNRATISRAFKMTVEFSGDCRCCEYRQYVRRRNFYTDPSWLLTVINGRWPRAPFDPPPNCDGDSTGEPCYVEDSDSQPEGCPGGCRRYGHREDSPNCFIDPTDNAYVGGDRVNACRFECKDEPTYSVDRFTIYGMSADFIGKVVTNDSPGCGPARVVATRSWTVCCIGIAGSGTPPTACGAPRNPDPLLQYRDFPVLVGADPAWVRISESEGYLVASLLIPNVAADAIIQSTEVELGVEGLDLAVLPSGRIPIVTSNGGSAAIAPRLFTVPGCFPTNVTVSGAYAGNTFSGSFDISELSPPSRSDFDGSGGTPDSTDIAAFFTAWLAGEDAADFDRSGGTPDSTDIEAFFVAWLNGC